VESLVLLVSIMTLLDAFAVEVGAKKPFFRFVINEMLLWNSLDVADDVAEIASCYAHDL
jgi:hypothetical protein